MTRLAIASLAFLSVGSFSTIGRLESFSPCLDYSNFSTSHSLTQTEWFTPRRGFYTEQRVRLRQKIRNRHHSKILRHQRHHVGHQHQIQRNGEREGETCDYRSVMLSPPEVRDKEVLCTDPGSPAEAQHQSQETDMVVNFFEKNEWKKNFASVECGAKLVKSSDNVKHPHHLITRNADEYLLYSCQDASYFVIELCETIKVIRFELDNYELYSGTVGRFSVRMADKFSNNKEDWVIIGSFEAGPVKMEVQHFTDLPVKSFGKFIRVDLESFHGSEHYCTLTSFRVFGMTEYEYLAINDGTIDVMDNSDVNDKETGVYSSKMIEVDMVNQESEQTTYFSYKSLFLQMRDDKCVDSMDLRTFEKATFKPDTNTIPEKNNHKQKDSVLISLSNKVKTLEKNVSVHQTSLRDLDTLFSQSSTDLKQILKSITKADAWIKDSGVEAEKTKSRMGDMSGKIQSLELELSRLEDTFLLGLGILAAALTGFIFTTVVCVVMMFCKQSKPMSKVEDNKVTRPLLSTKTSVSVQTDPPQIIKKVTFPDMKQEEENPVLGVEDISTKLLTARRKTDLSRRVTWCSGTFRNIAREPKKNREI